MAIRAETQVDLARVDDGYSPTATVTKTGDTATITITDKNQTTTASISDGDEGVSITSVKPQYYLSTSSSSATGGSWSDTPQAFVSGKYYWTRDYIDYSDGTHDTSTAVYNAALTQANQEALEANTKADNVAQYYWFNSTDSGAGEGAGAHITEIPRDDFVDDPSLGGFNTLVDADGLKIRNGVAEIAKYGLSARIGKENAARVEVQTDKITAYTDTGGTAFQVDSSGTPEETYIVKSIEGKSGVNSYTYTLTDTLSASSAITVTVNLWIGDNISDDDVEGTYSDFSFVYGTSSTPASDNHVTVAYNASTHKFTITNDGLDSTYHIENIDIKYYMTVTPSVVTMPNHFTLRNESISSAIFNPDVELEASQLTAYQSRAGWFTGGFITVGMWVYVNFYCEITASLSANNTWGLVDGFPVPAFEAPLTTIFYDASVSGGRASSKIGSYINDNGRLVLVTADTALASGDTLSITGLYLA